MSLSAAATPATGQGWHGLAIRSIMGGDTTRAH
jgi:hypothetical protein